MQRVLTIYIIVCSLLALSPLLTACSSGEDDRAVGDAPVPVAFEAAMGNKQVAQGRAVTRTPENAIERNASLTDKGGFGVFGCYTGLHKYGDSNVHPDFMYNEHVTSDDDGATWTYSPIKYWPNGEGEVTGVTGEVPHYVSFFAYAPYTDFATGDVGYCIPSTGQQGEIGNPWLTYRIHPDVAKQVDLLCASPLLDQTKPAIGEKLHFQFEHALACVGDRIDITCSDDMKKMLDDQLDGVRLHGVEVYLTDVSIDYTLTSKARLVLWNTGTANWQTIVSEDPTISLAPVKIVRSAEPQTVFKKNFKITATTSTWQDHDHGVYYIPKELDNYPQKAKVSVTYVVRYYTDAGLTAYTEEPAVTGTATLTLNKYEDAYQSGKHLYLNVSISMVAVSLTAAITPWVIEEKDVSAELQ